MPNDLDKSLLERLNALRGNSAGPEKPASTEINIDLIERRKTPTREDTLAARLKSLRERGDEPSPQAPKSAHQPQKPKPQASKTSKEPAKIEDDEDDSMFQTDDQTLEELLGDVRPEDGFQTEPDDAQVKALLEELADSIPKDADETDKKDQHDSDDSDGEVMNKDVDEVIARFRDEAEVEAALAKTKTPEPESESEPEQSEPSKTSDLALPDVPSDLADIPSSNRTASADIDDITARLAALRAPSPDEDSLALPSVPTSKPSGQPVKRLTTRTNYTDNDVESWCTVCLEDATLRCPGCDGDVYCTRCWYEMHRGPQAGFDEMSHKAIQFTKDKKTEKKEKRKVAMGA
ncbi:Ff.00g021640.m01.CDS01 [Fusarium sp. VM40]|nr:Ff.00g021640.m01.CDS01 [Fusarium sp. VM40]